MSYILDALRKSEARRRMGQAPGLDDARTTDGASGNQRRGGRFIVIGVAMVAVLTAATLAVVNRDQIGERMVGLGGEDAPPSAAEQPIEPVLPPAIDSDDAEREGHDSRPSRSVEPLAEAETDRPGPDGQPRERVLSDPGEIEAELARRVAEEERDAELAQVEQEDEDQPSSRRVRRAPEETVTAPAPRRPESPTVEQAERAAEIDRRLREIEARQRQADEEAEVARAEQPDSPPRESRDVPDEVEGEADEPVEMARATTPVPDAETWRPGGPEYVKVWELPLSIRRDLPELKLTIHVYSRDEQRRFVLVNGERFTTGDTIASGARLAEIRPEGAIIDYRNYRFLLEP